MKRERNNSGKLRIGDDWNAISIIALSQSNPLKAIAEFVENSIDARARQITVTRGREHGAQYLRIKDDGEGIRRDASGLPDFHHVATHICDSIKRRMKEEGARGIQGEFGIGLLSFWTVGEELVVRSDASDGHSWHMQMCKGEPTYRVTRRRVLLPEPGTEIVIRRVLPGVKQFSGEKIAWYLGSELRDRIRQTGVQVRVIDRVARAEFKVEPRQFEGRLLHDLPARLAPTSDLYLELYLAKPDPRRRVALFRRGTRVLEDIAQIEAFAGPPWTSGYLEGLIDAPTVNLTPGTRSGLVHDQTLDALVTALSPLATHLNGVIAEQQRAEDERASSDVLRSIQRALREAFLALPAEEYDWFNVRKPSAPRSSGPEQDGGIDPLILHDAENPQTGEAPAPQKEFFEFSGPLHSVRISPASSIVPVDGAKNLRAIARDRSGRTVDEQVEFAWQLLEGGGRIENDTAEICRFVAPAEPGLTRLRVTARQGETSVDADALVTVTESLLADARPGSAQARGIPDYTFEKAAGALWRSRFDTERNLIVVNSGHRDFVFASRTRPLKLRYISRLFAKELVIANFVGSPADSLLERLIELSLYTEENLR